MKVLVVKNIPEEGPGILKDIMDVNRILYDIIDLDSGEIFPDPQKYAAVLVFGGPDSANDSTEKMNDELKKVRKAVENGIPYMGICLGMQVLVKACGGKVRKNDIKEVGFKGPDSEYFKIDVCPGREKESLLKGLESSLKIFHLHGETVVITDEMELLATGKFCRDQVVKVGNNAYGFQGHFELTSHMLDMWLKTDQDLKTLNGDDIRNDFRIIHEEYRDNAEKLFTNFLHIAGLI
ncbi:type 1 glutamine amidotransferase [Methanolobus halotolerans]|uniref:Glutamine amidotransferase n=1 Tax=Methanolobus halotolerans TaxID=2052935 RepID=A0A4E0PV22_9EURY|nr:type 1 glutamine amidotransferase [Methanolobus halotolerans]TGC07447.1 glutamine amidotransferase [Methanolobus halotolerans]